MLKKEISNLVCIIAFATCFSTCAEIGSESGVPLELSGVPEKVELGNVVQISLFAEGNGLDFDYEWRPSEFNWSISSRATFIKQKNAALFTWDPIGGDILSEDPIKITFIVTDAVGRRTEKTVSFRITFGEGGPEFVSSVSELYNPRSKKPLTFNVKIKHPSCGNPDCVDIRLDETTAPVGATFDRDAPLAGTFRWEPLPEQLSARVQTINFIADDGDNPPVNHPVTVVIRNEGEIANSMEEELCPSEQAIRHTPLGPKRGLNDSYPLAVTTDAGVFDDIVVYWAPGTVLDDEGDLFSIKLSGDDAGNYTGEIPSVADRINEDIGALNINYQICGVKSDPNAKNSFVCVPSIGNYSFVASLPDARVCVDDKNEPNDSEAKRTIVGSEQWEYFMGCAGDEDHIEAGSPNEEESRVIFTYNQGAQIDISATNSKGDPVALKTSTCMGATFLETSTGPDGESFNIVVSGNNVPYRVRKQVLSGGIGNCVDAVFEPNENISNATPLETGAIVDGEICSSSDFDVYKLTAEAGEKLTITTEFEHAKGDLDMTLYSGADFSLEGFGLASTLSFDDVEVIEHRTMNGGTFYLKVINNDTTRNLYTLKVETDPAPPCDADVFSVADNHSQASGAFLESPGSGNLTLQNLKVCPDKDDWYKRTEFNGVTLVGALISSNVDQITWELFDLEGNLLSTASNIDDTLTLSFTPPQTMPLFHKISTRRDANYAWELQR